MADLTKVNGVANADIVKIDGVAAADIQKVDGIDKPSAVTTAGRWMIGLGGSLAASGKTYTTTAADASSGWELMIDFEADSGLSNAIGDIITGEDPEGNKRIMCHGHHQNREVMFTSASYNTEQLGVLDNWERKNPFQHADEAVAGPALAWGNDVWIMGGDKDAQGTDPETYVNLFRSTDGGETWSQIINGNTIADRCFAVAYKGSGGIWLASTQSHIWKSTDDGVNWTDKGALQAGTKDIKCIAYDGSGRWVTGLAGGTVYYSDDDGENWTESTGEGFGTRAVQGVIYAKGSINKWVIVGSSGEISYSSDAASDSWTNVRTVNYSGSYKNIDSIATDDTTIVAVGGTAGLYTSTDAINWTAHIDMADLIGTLHCRCVGMDLIGTGTR